MAARKQSPPFLAQQYTDLTHRVPITGKDQLFARQGNASKDEKTRLAVRDMDTSLRLAALMHASANETLRIQWYEVDLAAERRD
ncbi:MAG: hypothetical protein LQ340_006977 [Diploschistes diacapsis]|nr:MAG: hypothetical protein LQ340_006977 [Diploschistes diacapsis]